MRRRSQPLLIAPAIPLLGIVGLFGVDRLHGTRWLPVFIAVWVLLLAALFVFVLSKTLAARARTRR